MVSLGRWGFRGSPSVCDAGPVTSRKDRGAKEARKRERERGNEARKEIDKEERGERGKRRMSTSSATFTRYGEGLRPGTPHAWCVSGVSGTGTTGSSGAWDPFSFEYSDL